MFSELYQQNCCFKEYLGKLLNFIAKWPTFTSSLIKANKMNSCCLVAKSVRNGKKENVTTKYVNN